MACEIRGRSSLPSFHWFVLYIYAPLQLELLLVNDWIRRCGEATTRSPGMRSLNTSGKLGHVMGAMVFLRTYSVGRKLW